jgi:hypothetical protein
MRTAIGKIDLRKHAVSETRTGFSEFLYRPPNHFHPPNSER